MKESLEEVLLMSDKYVLPFHYPPWNSDASYYYALSRIIQDLVAKVVQDIGVLYKASEAVSHCIEYW